jgi:hypothetical protein
MKSHRDDTPLQIYNRSRLFSLVKRRLAISFGTNQLTA